LRRTSRRRSSRSSILNLFSAIVRPHIASSSAARREAKERSLNDYILPSDRAAAAVEWQLDPAADSPGLESERFLMGVFFERASRRLG
jgi:hypothetical protein